MAKHSVGENLNRSSGHNEPIHIYYVPTYVSTTLYRMQHIQIWSVENLHEVRENGAEPHRLSDALVV